MQNTYQIIAKDDETGKEVEYVFDKDAYSLNHLEFREKMSQIQEQYAIIQKHTLVSVVLQRKNDLFSDV